MFSSSQAGPRRDRAVWSQRRGSLRAFEDRAKNLLHAPNLYDAAEATFLGMVDESPEKQRRAVDRIWDSFETSVPLGIECLVASRESQLSGSLWLRTLVPFVASLFIRGKTFMDSYSDHRDELLASSEGIVDVNADANGSRSYQFQRLLTPIAAANWCVIHTDSHPALITNDLALARFENVAAPLKWGWLVPLTPAAVLAVNLRYERKVMEATDGGELVPVISHIDIEDSDWVHQANERIAEDALEMVIGQSRSHVESVSSVLSEESRRIENVLGPWLQLPHENLAAHQFDWHHLATAILAGKEADGTYPLEALDPQALWDSGWTAPFIWDPVRPIHGLKQTPDGSIHIDLRVPQGYTVPYAVPPNDHC